MAKLRRDMAQEWHVRGSSPHAEGSPPALAAKAASSTIPIVILVGIDPVQSGLVASLNRPGGNVTGLAVLTVQLAAKHVGAADSRQPPRAASR
jgi:ABC-type uncharacterized transport system substrate-binding protein